MRHASYQTNFIDYIISNTAPKFHNPEYDSTKIRLDLLKRTAAEKRLENCVRMLKRIVAWQYRGKKR